MSTLGITWSPQYFLDVLSDEGQHTFQAFADIMNQTKQEFCINRTELISGEAVLGISNNSKYGFRRRRSRSESIRSESSLVLDEDDEPLNKLTRAMPAIDSLPEIGGKYQAYFYTKLIMCSLLYLQVFTFIRLIERSICWQSPPSLYLSTMRRSG